MDYLTNLINSLPDIVKIGMGIVTVASLICAGTNTPDPSTFLGKAYKVLEWLALNVFKSKQ